MKVLLRFAGEGFYYAGPSCWARDRRLARDLGTVEHAIEVGRDLNVGPLQVLVATGDANCDWSLPLSQPRPAGFQTVPATIRALMCRPARLLPDMTMKRQTQQTFQIAAPDAKTVLLVGDFTDWHQRGIAMRQDRSGVWTTTVKLAPGAHRYRFIVDGEWRDDPQCSSRAPNPYGSEDMVRQAA